MGTPTSNKGYLVPTLNGDFGTWGTELNGNFGLLDLNLGGSQTVTLASGNVNFTSSQASFLYTTLVGTLTGNATVTVPAAGGLYVINNSTAGAFSVTIACAGGGGVVVIPQNSIICLVCDGTNVVNTNTAIATTVSVSGQVSAGGGVRTSGADSGGIYFRANTGTASMGLRIDSNFAYLADANSSSGGYSAHRPFTWALSNGAVTIDATGVGITTGGAMSLGGALAVTGNINATGTVGATGGLSIASLNTTGGITAGGNINASGTIGASGGISISSLSTSGAISAGTNINASGTIGATGGFSISNLSTGNISATGTIHSGSGLSGATLSLTGGAAIASLTVSGASSFTGAINTGGTIGAGADIVLPNSHALQGKTTAGVQQPLLYYGNDNNTYSSCGTAGNHYVMNAPFTVQAAKISSVGLLSMWAGYNTKSGSAGSFNGNAFNVQFSGGFAGMYIDTTFQGNFSYASDPRIKQNITDAPAGALNRVNQWKTVEWEFADVGIFKADGIRRVGFVSSQIQTISPSAVTGTPDGLTSDGLPQPQTLEILPMLAELTGAIQALTARVAALEAK